MNVLTTFQKRVMYGVIVALFVVFCSGFFAQVYLAVRTDRVNTAICVPIDRSETRLYFSAPKGLYLGWFSVAPELGRSLWKESSVSRGVDSVSIRMGENAPIEPEMSDRDSFTFNVPEEVEFQRSEVMVTAKEPLGKPLYLNIRPSF